VSNTVSKPVTEFAIDLCFSAEVEAASDAGVPIVALESTIITHGMPYPQNIEVAALVEQDIRAAGAAPATIAVLDGRLHIGLEKEELTALGQARDIAKLSRADLAACLATGGTGATTVAATMIAAHHVGIDVFATGGIGGVHRGAEISFDISADLHELAQTPVTVVAAGAKAILDIPKTLEVLETLGVPVIAYGQDELPAFWSAKSALNAPLRMDNPASIARAHATRRALGLPGGQLVTNPIPSEAEITADLLAPIIAEAQADADRDQISGKAVTPYLLQRIYERTEGRSLEANIALIRNNARLAAQIALELSELSA
jgi:pseudouridine-5'-phosphate glycosidase